MELDLLVGYIEFVLELQQLVQVNLLALEQIVQLYLLLIYLQIRGLHILELQLDRQFLNFQLIHLLLVWVVV